MAQIPQIPRTSQATFLTKISRHFTQIFLLYIVVDADNRVYNLSLAYQ